MLSPQAACTACGKGSLYAAGDPLPLPDPGGVRLSPTATSILGRGELRRRRRSVGLEATPKNACSGRGGRSRGWARRNKFAFLMAYRRIPICPVESSEWPLKSPRLPEGRLGGQGTRSGEGAGPCTWGSWAQPARQQEGAGLARLPGPGTRPGLPWGPRSHRCSVRPLFVGPPTSSPRPPPHTAAPALRRIWAALSRSASCQQGRPHGGSGAEPVGRAAPGHMDSPK